MFFHHFRYSMGIVKYVINLFGFTQDNNQGSTANSVNATKRKRAPEDEESLSSDVGSSYPSKNILHSQPPVKRAKMEDTEVEIVEVIKAKSPIRRGIDALKNLFWQKKEEELTKINTTKNRDDEISDTNHQIIETVDLIGNKKQFLIL